MENESRGRRGFSRGRGRGREMVCFICNIVGHISYECPENAGTGQRNVVVAPAEEREEKTIEAENIPEIGECFMMIKVLLKAEKISC